MFDLSTFGPAVVSIGGFAALIVFIKALAGGDEHPLDDSLPRGRQEEEPIRFRFPKILAPAPSGAAASSAASLLSFSTDPGRSRRPGSFAVPGVRRSASRDGVR